MIRARVVFPQPGRTVEQDVVEDLTTLPCRIEEQLQLGLEALLPHEILEALRPEAELVAWFLHPTVGQTRLCFAQE